MFFSWGGFENFRFGFSIFAKGIPGGIHGKGRPDS